jgi:hypothetical protein
MSIFISTVLAVLVLAGCKPDYNENEAEIVRFDEYAVKVSPDSLAEIFPDALWALSVINGEHDLSLPQIAEIYRQSPVVKVFEPDVMRILPNLDKQNEQLGSLKHNMSILLPDAWFPESVYGFVTPYNQSVFAVDSVMMIGLNHYLGYDYEGYEVFDGYKRKLKVAERIPYDVCEALLYIQYPFVKTVDDIISGMLYEGAIIYAELKLIKESSPRQALGYDATQWKWLEDNKANIWKVMAEKNLLYTREPLMMDKLLNPAPATGVIHPEAPGRTGRYIGYEIVKAYMEKYPDTEIAFLLSPGFYTDKTTLIKAEYSPN